MESTGGRLDVDYDDWAEALGTWLGCIHHPSGDLDFEAWAAVWSLLDRREEDAREHAMRSSHRAARQYGRSIIVGGEFAFEVFVEKPELWEQLWSGLASHRAAADWLAHLVVAGTARTAEDAGFTDGAPDGLAELIVTGLALALRRARGSSGLDTHWATRSHDPRSASDPQVVFDRTTSWLRDSLGIESGGYGAIRWQWPATGPVPVTACRYLGHSVRSDEVADAGLQALTSGELLVLWPPAAHHSEEQRPVTPLIVEPSEDRRFPVAPLLVRPLGVTAASITGHDVITNTEFEIGRSFYAPTGWEIVGSWTSSQPDR